MTGQPDAQLYSDGLQQFICELKNELDALGLNAVPVQDRERLDGYLLEINAYYYQSFHQRFYPQYEDRIKKEVVSLLNLSLQETTLKQDIVVNLAHHARLYNRVRHFLNIVNASTQEIDNLLLTAAAANNNLILELHTGLKEWRDHLRLFDAHLKRALSVMQDKKLMDAINRFHFPPVPFADRDNNRWNRDYNRIVSELQLLVKLLVRLQSCSDIKEVKQLPDELDISLTRLVDKKIFPLLRNWFRQYLQALLVQSFDLLRLYVDKNDIKRSKKTAQDIENWLQKLIDYLERNKFYHDQGWLDLMDYASLLARLDKKTVQELGKNINDYLTRTGVLIDELSVSPQAVYANYSQAALLLLEEIQHYLDRQVNNDKLQMPWLSAGIMQLKRQASLLEAHVYMLNDQQEYAKTQEHQYQTIKKVLASYAQYLAEVEEELTGILSPRSIKRRYQDLNITLQRIPLIKGDILEAGLVPLSGHPAVEWRDGADEEYKILHAEGDIFIIKLDDLRENVIPPLVLSGKGK